MSGRLEDLHTVTRMRRMPGGDKGRERSDAAEARNANTAAELWDQGEARSSVSLTARGDTAALVGFPLPSALGLPTSACLPTCTPCLFLCVGCLLPPECPLQQEGASVTFFLSTSGVQNCAWHVVGAHRLTSAE